MKNSPFKYFKILATAKLKQFVNILPFYKHNTYTPFLIVGHARTGTSLLHTYLNSHLNILSLNEALSHTDNGLALFKPYSKLIKVVGFKYFYEYSLNESKLKTLIQLIENYQIKVIKIHRKNYLRTYVSLRIAQQTQAWSSTAKVEVNLNSKQISLSKEECIQAFQDYKNQEYITNEIFQKYNVATIEIDYNDLDQYPDREMNKVQTFLGVEPQTVASLLKRQNPESVKELILNYDELKSAFKNTDYEIFFEE